jgi:dihydroorotase
MKTIIRNATIVNENKIFTGDVLIHNDRIEKISSSITMDNQLNYHEINAEGLYLFPGVIDDQVHFREPGLTHKATIYSESKAAVAGGVTSYMDMPNTIPNVLTQSLLEEKYELAAHASLANYSFFMGINQYNLEEALRTDTETVCGITDDGLYFNEGNGMLVNYPDYLAELFSKSPTLIALHSESDQIIKSNTEKFRLIYGDDIPMELHAEIRSEAACFETTKQVIELAAKHKARLHLFHISTASEALLFDNKTPIREKLMTAEVCLHHLWFNSQDYERLGAKIKWNPSVKSKENQLKLLEAVKSNHIDFIATDHAPHTASEKDGNYFNAHSGGPLVQHLLPAMLNYYHKNELTLEKIAALLSHNVAEAYRIIDRGYIREGYFADLVLVDINNSWQVSKENILYKCKWSPFEGESFGSKIITTIVNGKIVYQQGEFNDEHKGKRLLFEKNRH